MIVRFKGEGYKLASAQYKNNRSQWKCHDSKKKKKKSSEYQFYYTSENQNSNTDVKKT